DYLLVPTDPDDLATKAVPHFLNEVSAGKPALFPHLQLKGVIINKTIHVEREEGVVAELQPQIQDVGLGPVRILQPHIPRFLEEAKKLLFPAQHKLLRGIFKTLVENILGSES